MTESRTDGLPELHLGTSGWSYPGWRGRFYPAGLPARGWLPYYADRFDTVEINMTFYRYPTVKTLTGWIDLTPPEFLFTLKAPRLITHLKRLRKVGHDVEFFYRQARSLGTKLGCILFQLPPSIVRDDALLAEFLSALSPEFRNVIEFRDPSWLVPEVFDVLRGGSTALCIVSSTRVPAVAALTTKTAYFRFHGLTAGYRHDYSDEELRHWAGVMKSTGAAETFAYFNNDYQAFAAANALRLRELLAG